MFLKSATAILLLSASQFASAQSNCDAFKSAIESSLKSAASSTAEGIMDNSAPRATMRQLEISNSLALAQMNLSLMAQNKCATRTTPINPSFYIGDALSCELARTKGEKDSPACKQENWKGLSGKSAGKG